MLPDFNPFTTRPSTLTPEIIGNLNSEKLKSYYSFLRKDDEVLCLVKVLKGTNELLNIYTNERIIGLVECVAELALEKLSPTLEGFENTSIAGTLVPFLSLEIQVSALVNIHALFHQAVKRYLTGVKKQTFNESIHFNK